MAGTQGSSYSSSSKAAAGNKQTTQNLQKGLNASGSVKTNSGLGNKPASSSVNAAAAAAARTAAARAATASTQRTQNSGGGISARTMAANYGAFNNPAATRMDSYNANSRNGAGGVPAQEAISKGKSGISASLNPQESAYQGKGAFNPPQTSISANINNSLNSVLSRFGQMAATPFGASPIKSPVSNGLAQYDALAGLSSPYARPMSAIVAGDPMRVGYNPVDNIVSVSPDPISEWGNKMGGYGIQAAARGIETLAKTVPKSPDRVPAALSPTQSAAAGYRNYDPVAELNKPSAYSNQVSVLAREPVGYAPMQSVQNPARTFPTRTIAAPSENYNWNGSPNYAAANAAGINQAFNVNSTPKVAMEGSIPGGISPNSVPSLPNYASPVSVANREPSPYDAQTQVAGYQNPARAFPSRTQPTQTAMNSPMAGQGVSFSNNRYSMPAAGYNQEIVRALANQRAVSAGLLGNAGTDTFGKYAPGQVAEAPASSADPNATTDYGIYDQQPTRFQKFKASVEKKGDWVNGLLGGTSQNQPGWTPSGNPNARDPLNNLPPKEREKVVTEAGKAATDPEFKALSDGDKTKVLELIKTGMSLADALKAIKTGTTTPPTRPTYRYPQYASDWAGLPSGQTYG